ncbi:hypothetical protein ABIJ78_004598 [Salmonella enterica]
MILLNTTPEQVELWRKANPFQNIGTVWLYDYSRNTVIEKRADGANITHISQGGKRLLLPLEQAKPNNDA